MGQVVIEKEWVGERGDGRRVEGWRGWVLEWRSERDREREGVGVLMRRDETSGSSLLRIRPLSVFKSETLHYSFHCTGVWEDDSCSVLN